jgi:hypothetical protein
VKNKTIKVTQAQCIKIAQQCNVKKKVALQMFQLLSDIHDAAIAVKKPLKRKNAPKYHWYGTDTNKIINASDTKELQRVTGNGYIWLKSKIYY